MPHFDREQGEDQRADENRSELERARRGIRVGVHIGSIAGEFPFSSNSQKPSEVGLFAGEPVDRFTDQVGVAVVPRVLLDHVDEDPTQTRRPTVGPLALSQLVQAAVG